MKKRFFKAFILITGLVLLMNNNLYGIMENEQNQSVVRKYEGLKIVLDQTDQGIMTIEYTFNDFSRQEVLINGNHYEKLRLGNESSTSEKGMPELPVVCRSVIIPDEAHMTVKVASSEYYVLKGINIAPSKGVLYRNVNPDHIPYEFNETYQRDAWYPEEIIELTEPYILRDFRGQVVRVYPFQYNPARNELRVYSRVSVQVYSDRKSTINVLERKTPLISIDPDFKRTYEKHFLNFGLNSRYAPVEEHGNMLVITYDNFSSAMEPFVAWKNMKGLPTQMVRLSEIGNTEYNIKDYITDYYNTRGLTYVLLVGDIQQMPSFHFNFSGEQGASDPTYSYIVGNDHYPDLFVGRFSAQNLSEVSNMVQRSIEYEQYPQIGATWYHQGTGIASNEGTGDDGEYDWEHIRNIRTGLLDYTYSLVDELYDGSHGGGDASGNPTTTMVSNAINSGRSVINYCGHGGPTSWGTSGFSNGNVTSLVNHNTLPFIWSVACSNGAFDDVTTCFAEAWLRATNSGEPTGAVAAFMSSILQSWSPPMEAQDEMNAILVESYQDNIKRTFGGISFNGCMSMNDKYGSAGYQMTDTWHVFGDPALEVRTASPGNLVVTHNPSISVGSNGFDVMVTGAQNALCALSRDGILLGSGYTNGAGRALIHLEEPLTSGSDLKLVVTGYNMVPYEVTINVNTGEPVLYVDDSHLGFAILNGNWRYGSNPEACNGEGYYIRQGSGLSNVAWRVDHIMTPGTYDVYAWKFEHSRMFLMATDAHYKVHHSAGESDWIIVDQSTPGNEWIYLGSFEFDTGAVQSIELTDQANGVVIADVVKLVGNNPRYDYIKR